MSLVRICSIKGCKNKYVCKGYCGTHYRKLKIYGDPLIEVKKTLSEAHKKKLSEAHTNPSKEIRKKLSEAQKGKKQSKKTIEKRTKKLKGIKRTELTKKKMSEAQKGHIVLESTKKKLSELMTGKMSGNKHPLYGKKSSEITKNKKSISMKIFHDENPEFSKIHSERLKGRKASEKTRRKMKISQNKPIILQGKRERRLHQKFPRKDTKLEITAQKILQENNIEFIRLKAILGQPDIFIEPNFCIFMDGDHFHGNPDMFEDDHVIFKEYNGKSGHAPELTAKIKREKDHKINLKLKAQGYLVMRTYETPFYENPKKWLNEVKKFIKNA